MGGRPKGDSNVLAAYRLPRRVVLIRWTPSRWHAYTLDADDLPVSTVHTSLRLALAAYPRDYTRFGYPSMSGARLVDALIESGCAWRCLRMAKCMEGDE